MTRTDYLDYHFDEIQLSNGHVASGYAEVEYEVSCGELDFTVTCINVTLNDGDDNLTHLVITNGGMFFDEIVKNRNDYIGEECWDAIKGSF